MLPATFQVPVALVLLLGGTIACFFGYRLFRIVLAIFGFIPRRVCRQLALWRQRDHTDARVGSDWGSPRRDPVFRRLLSGLGAPWRWTRCRAGPTWFSPLAGAIPTRWRWSFWPSPGPPWPCISSATSSLSVPPSAEPGLSSSAPWHWSETSWLRQQPRQNRCGWRTSWSPCRIVSGYSSHGSRWAWLAPAYSWASPAVNTAGSYGGAERRSSGTHRRQLRAAYSSVTIFFRLWPRARPIFLSSSMAEHPAVNRRVAGSSPA